MSEYITSDDWACQCIQRADDNTLPLALAIGRENVDAGDLDDEAAYVQVTLSIPPIPVHTTLQDGEIAYESEFSWDVRPDILTALEKLCDAMRRDIVERELS